MHNQCVFATVLHGYRPSTSFPLLTHLIPTHSPHSLSLSISFLLYSASSPSRTDSAKSLNKFFFYRLVYTLHAILLATNNLLRALQRGKVENIYVFRTTIRWMLKHQRYIVKSLICIQIKYTHTHANCLKPSSLRMNRAKLIFYALNPTAFIW